MTMDATTSLKPRPLSELLPYLSGIVSKDGMQTLTTRKQPRPAVAQTRTAEKTMKPVTMAELMAGIPALRHQSPRRQTTTSVKKKIWNSSVKVESKKISHTADGHMKHNPVRKVLNFQPKPRNTLAPRITIINAETPKFPKPEYRAKKSIHLPVKNNVRISGICKIPETPTITQPSNNRMIANKENMPNVPRNLRNIVTPKVATPKIVPTKKFIPKIPDTPLSNQSWQSSCDGSFLQKEKEIHDIEEKIKNVAEEKTLERIAEVSPPASTPFKEYRNVKKYFDNSCDLDNSVLNNDDTIMCFDKTFQPTDNNKREESVITSLCEMLNKASVTNTEDPNTDLNDLLEVEKQTMANVKILDKIREQELKSLEYIRKLINEKRKQTNSERKNTNKVITVAENKNPEDIKTEKIDTMETPVACRMSVIKSCHKSPSYKIPRRNTCLRKKVFCKSMPNVSSIVLSPNRDLNDKALSVYMDMKKHMNFLTTPVVKERKTTVPDTPSITSHNLQKQLDKLYDDNN